MNIKLSYKFGEISKDGLYIESMTEKDLEYICDMKKRISVVYGEFHLDSDYNNNDFLLDKASHCLENINLFSDRIELEIRILNTKYGNKLKDYIDENDVYLAPRLKGSVNESSGRIDIERIFTFDVSNEKRIMLTNDDQYKRLLRNRRRKIKKLKKK